MLKSAFKYCITCLTCGTLQHTKQVIQHSEAEAVLNSALECCMTYLTCGTLQHTKAGGTTQHCPAEEHIINPKNLAHICH